MRYHDPRQDALVAANRGAFGARPRPSASLSLAIAFACLAAAAVGLVAWMTQG